MTTAGTEMGLHETEDEMIQHSLGQTRAMLTAAATLPREAIQRRIVFAWGEVLCIELTRVWGLLDTAERLAYADKLATQVHVLDDASVSLRLLAQTLKRTGRRLQRHLHSWRSSHLLVAPTRMP